RATELCVDAMRAAAAVAGRVADLWATDGVAASTPEPSGADKSAVSIGETLASLERCAQALGELRGSHRATTLSAVAIGALTADEAITRVDKVRSLEGLAYHAWRCAAYLVDSAIPDRAPSSLTGRMNKEDPTERR